MEALTEEQREQITKMSDQRLKDRLRRAGMPEAAVNVLDRQALIAAWAAIVASGLDKPPAAAAAPIYTDPELEQKRLQFEERKWAEEMRLREAEFTAQQHLREAELEAQKEQLRLDAEKVSLERERLRLQIENAESPAVQLKRYGDALRGALSHMPVDAADLPAFFDNAERLFADIKAPLAYQAQLLMPYLSDKARALVGRMDKTKSSQYKEVKALILREFKLTPLAYWNKFQTSTKLSNETYVMFITRLHTLLTYYTESRQVKTFDDLISLMISDHVKPALPSDCLKHVLSVENTTDVGWLKHSKLGEVIDTYLSNQIPQTDNNNKVSQVFTETRYSSFTDKGHDVKRHFPHRSNQPNVQNEERRCFECDSRLHLAKHCPHRQTSSSRYSGVNKTPRATNHKPLAVHTMGAILQESESESDTDTPSSPSQSFPSTGEATTPLASAMHLAVATLQEPASLSPSHLRSNHQDTLDVHSIQLDLADLSFIDVDIEGVQYPIKAVHDSGAQISVIHPDVLTDILCTMPREGKVKLRGLFGEPVDAYLISLHIKHSHSDHGYIPIIMAVTDKANNELILTDPVVQALLHNQTHDSEVEDDFRRVFADTLTDCSTSDSEDEASVPISNDPTSTRGTTNHKASKDELIQEQRDDPTLASCWALARKGKGGYYVKDDMLFHHCVIAGQGYEQLCLPKCRRSRVITLAHEVYGSHLGTSKTKDRIRLSFYWPTLISDCKKHCKTCEDCQKRSRITVRDRVPISPIPRSEEIFSHWFMDCLGPLFPNQKVQYNYCLVLCDSASRWPAAYPLHSLTAKSVCEALLKQFAITGVPNIVSSDNASNFRGNLTQEFLRRLGCSPRFSTPNHPAACGLVERLVGTIKSAISKVAREHPRQWHTHLSCILWALREAPNETTGVPPWLMAFGRLPRGPLAILKDSWSGTEDLPLDLGKGVAEYLSDLRQRFQSVDEFASEHTKKKQIHYATHYNLRSRDKSFDVGEQVLILAPDSTASKTFSRWKGPAVIAVKKSPYSYLVDLDGIRMHIHANKLRKYHNRVAQVHCFIPQTLPLDAYSAIIYEKDVDFGDVVVPEPVPPPTSLSLPSNRIDYQRLAHLTLNERAELLSLLDNFSDCFSDSPGFCSLVEHTIPLSGNFAPKRLPPYRIPLKLRSQVEQQLEELLKLGIIRHSKSPMASPVICLLKGKDGKGGVRLAIDYRYVNKFTVADAYPVPDLADIIQEVGKARLISTFDATKGYYQTPVKEEDRWLTAFICEFGLFEFTRTPFGMRSSGATFVRAIQQALQPVRQFTASYVDDMSVYSDFWQSHLQHLEDFLLRIRCSGFTLNLTKCNFALAHVKFVGHIIGSGTRKPDPAKLSAVKYLPLPCDKKQVRQVIGLFSYFREYIPNFAEHAHCLTELTKKGVPDKIPWGPNEQHAFDSLKELLCNATDAPLSIVDVDKPYKLYVDASNCAIGAVLTQMDAQGHDRPVAFASLKLTSAQKAWATVEKEAFAAIWALQKFRRWLFWCPVTVLSDHNPLMYLTQASPRSAKLMRWALALQEFDVSFKYKEGRNNAAADCLSRVGSHLP